MTEETRNSRTSRRVHVNYLATLKTGSDNIEGTVAQISEGGLLFLTSKPGLLRARGIFALRVLLSEPEVALEGEVIYQLPPKKGSKAIEYGVRFTDHDTKQKEAIASILRYSTVRERYSPKTDTVEKF